MKKLLVVLMAALMLCAFSFGAMAEGTPWEDPEVKLHVVSDFSEFADGEVDIAAEPFWAGSGANFNWDVKYEEGKMVFYGTKVPGMADNFRLGMTTLTEDVQKAAQGVGFYLENNSEYEQRIGYFFIGSVCIMSNMNSYVYLIDENGAISEADSDGGTCFFIPAEFKGYVMSPIEGLFNAWGENQPQWDVATAPIGAFGLQFGEMELDKDAGETFVVDNFFFYGTDLEENLGDITIGEVTAPTEKPAETPTPAPGTATPSVGGSATAGTTQGTDDKPADSNIWLWVGIGAAVVVVAAVVIVIASKKKGSKDGTEE